MIYAPLPDAHPHTKPRVTIVTAQGAAGGMIDAALWNFSKRKAELASAWDFDPLLDETYLTQSEPANSYGDLRRRGRVRLQIRQRRSL